MRIEEATPVAVTNLWQSIESRVHEAGSLDTAAQEMVKALHLRFDESIALARVFFTVPFGLLPAANQEFVRNLADSSGAGSDLKETTPSCPCSAPTATRRNGTTPVGRGATWGSP